MKERDPLELFILENREHFDDAFPSLKVWNNIDQAVNRRSTRRLKVLRTVGAIAAGIALLLTGAFAGSLFFQAKDAQAVAILEQSAPEFIEAERYYQGEIQQKVAQLASYSPNDPVLKDLKQIDQVMEELKADLTRAPKGKEQEIVAALIRSYQMKISILELVMERLEQQESLTFKTKRNETSL